MKKFIFLLVIPLLTCVFSPPAVSQVPELKTEIVIKKGNEIYPGLLACIMQKSGLEITNESEPDNALIRYYADQTIKASAESIRNITDKQRLAEDHYRYKNAIRELSERSDYRTALYKETNSRKYKIRVVPLLE